LDYQKRVLQFDPSNVPNQFMPKPYKRHQFVSIGNLFPDIDGLCSCGCGKELTGRRSRWATNDCQNYAVAVRFILAGHTNTIKRYMRLYYGWKCSQCGCSDKGHEMGANGTVAWIKIDHIVPVKHGGGACWLSNYQLLCHDCHTGKTNNDFGWRNQKSIKPPELFKKSA
jgi:5-methylcytosine-specific restriction endonuclease McrA